MSRTTEGDFLSSDDIELLVTLSNYVAIAIENSRLYSSLQRKADEYERLKEFSENIVESINVGILAADLDDRVESWNTQIEKLTGISREEAMGRRLCELFPPELCQKFDDLRGRRRHSQRLQDGSAAARRRGRDACLRAPFSRNGRAPEWVRRAGIDQGAGSRFVNRL